MLVMVIILVIFIWKKNKSDSSFASFKNEQTSTLNQFFKTGFFIEHSQILPPDKIHIWLKFQKKLPRITRISTNFY
jgi:hypothetical protein